MQSRRLVRKPAFLRMTPSPPHRAQVTRPALPPSAPVPLHTVQSSGRDLRYTLELDFEEAALGCEKVVVFERPEDCSVCSGTGAEGGSAGLVHRLGRDCRNRLSRIFHQISSE